MIKATWGLLYWPAWMALTALTFLPAEIYAICTDPANTLSDFAWREFGFPSNGAGLVYTAGWYLSFAAYLVAVVVLGIHIWFMKLR